MGCEWVGWRTVSALVEIKHETIRVISHVQVQQEDCTEESERQLCEELARQMRLEHQDAAAAIAEEVAGIKVLHVVAAAIFNKQGDLLIAQRPLDKHMSGFLEFPGGKVEAGEAVTDALCRELDEELVIQPLSLESLISIEHTYPEKKFCSMSGSSGILVEKLTIEKGKPYNVLHLTGSISLNFPKSTTTSLRR